MLNRIDQDYLPIMPPGMMQFSDVLSMLNQMILNLSAFSGLAMESMTRGPGWRFLDMGRRFERSMYTVSLLRSMLLTVNSDEEKVLDVLLEIADSSMTYRNRYLTSLQLPPLVDLLISDETNLRFLAFQLVGLADHVEQLPREQREPLMTLEQRTVLAALTYTRLRDIDALCIVEKDGTRKQLDRMLGRLSTQLRILSEVITHKYLVHAGPAWQMAEIRPGRR